MATVAFPQHSKIVTLPSGITYSYLHIAAHPNNPTFLFLHGFPSSSYDWRFQISQFSSQGYGVLVADLLGYGATDRPISPSAYTGKKMASEITEILDHEKLQKVHGVAHDWGCFLLARLANWFPERLVSASFLAVPYRPPGVRFDLEERNSAAKEAVGYEVFGYWKFFEREDAGEILRDHVSNSTLSKESLTG
jgi:soluble epoxide hydrolase/lipid-phosphate phosphatase